MLLSVPVVLLICLVDLLLLVDTESTGTSVDDQQQTTNDAQDLKVLISQKVTDGVFVLKGPSIG